MDKQTDYKRYLIRKGIRQGTIEKHCNSLTYIFSTIQTLEVSAVEGLLFSLFEQGRSPGYLNILIQSVRSYGEFIHNEDYKKIKYFKVDETDKGILSDDEIIRFLAITADDYNRWLRTTLKRGGGHVNPHTWKLFTLFFRCLSLSGMRPSELSTMTTEQCNLGSRLFHLNNKTKTRKGRTVTINDMLVPFLEQHLQTLTTNRLFPPSWDRHVWKKQFNRRIKYLGINRPRITTYSLRFSWITRLLDEGANPHVMAEMAGHSLKQQAHYYRLTSKSKRLAMQKDPLSRKQLSKTDKLIQGRKALEDMGYIVLSSREQNGRFFYECLDE